MACLKSGRLYHQVYGSPQNSSNCGGRLQSQTKVESMLVEGEKVDQFIADSYIYICISCLWLYT